MDFSGFQTLIAALGDGDKNSAEEVRTILSNLIENIFLPGDIKMVYCTQAEIETDYTPDGLGLGKRAGWRICNGLLGTPPMAGRVPVGYGDGYTGIATVSGIGGSATHTLTKAQIPALDVPYVGSNDDTGDPGNYLITSPSSPNGDRKLVTEGGGEPHSIMQPYTILLYLMKLP